MAKVEWDPTFGPSYTPEEMLDLGVFEGTYVRAIKGLPKSWYNKPKVLKRGEPADPKLNKFKVKSRLSLKEWQKRGWIREDPGGWYEWFCRYWLGRRLPKEDKFQIGRWRSFVARHQGQIVAAGQLKDLDKRVKQRQGLLQWGWDSTVKFTDEQVERNAKRIAGKAGAVVTAPSTESLHRTKLW